MDDGTVARLREDAFYVTTTSTGSEAVLGWLEWWNAVWRMEVEIVNLTGAVAALNLAGPGARDVLAALADADVGAEAVRYLDAHEASVAGVPTLLLRIGFVGELGYELHFASPHAEHVWDTLVAAGATPFGLEAQRVLRLEKQHVIVGQDTDSESTLPGAGMAWLPKLDKDDFVGKRALELERERGPRERLVGFELAGRDVPREGSQVVSGGRSTGRVTSARFSAELGRTIGLAWVPAELATEGARFEIRTAVHPLAATVRLRPFYDPDGARLRS
jgi:sarcosine oxidase subunit alpha